MLKNIFSTRTVLGLLLLSLTNFSGFAQAATLNSPTHNDGLFQFNLDGDAYRHYIIQGSSNLQDWVSLTTNVSPTATRPLSFVTSNGFEFYRSAPWIRTNSIGKAIQTTGSFDWNGNVFQLDSFDSRDPSFSTNGRYDELKRKDTAELSSDQGLTNSLPVGNARIYGSISTGPGASLTIGPNGTVGSLAWINGGQKGIQPGKYSIDLCPYFPEVRPPFAQGIVPTGGSITNSDSTVTFYDYILHDGEYQVNLSGKVGVLGNARVFNMGAINADQIIIATNASLKLYVAGQSSVSGVSIRNEGSATNFIYYGMPENKNVVINANGGFTGIIYAPQARVVLNGGGSDVCDFTGAIVADSVKLNGHFHFHYDEALRELSFPE